MVNILDNIGENTDVRHPVAISYTFCKVNKWKKKFNWQSKSLNNVGKFNSISTLKWFINQLYVL